MVMMTPMTTVQIINRVNAMKNLFKFMMPVAIATMTLISCNKEVNSAEPATGETLRINVTAVADDLLGLDGTRTYIGTYNDTPNTIIWGENESMKIAVLGDGDADKATYGYSTTSEYAGEAEATFGFEITPAEGKTGNTYTYVGLYPASASVDNSSITAHKVELKSTQDATADSYDPKSYILIAMHEDGKTTSNADWTASYRRATALNKITLKGLAEGIVSVKITLPENAKFAGRRNFNLLTDEFGEVYSASNTIEVSFATPLTGTDIDGVNNKVVWFNSWGVSLAEGEEMTIVAKSATKSYTKTIAARSGGISFKQGYLNTLGVNMSGISGEEMVYDGCYAELLYEDVSDQLSNSYGLAEVTKNYGDNWKMFAVSSNGAIGVRRNDKPSSGTLQNDSYIKLPDFSDNINSVVVTLKNVTEGKTITLENSATATGGTIASLPTTSATVYTFNLSGDIKTAYFRCTGFQAQVEKIVVYAGEDTRTSISSPSNVVAALNPSSTTSIDVSWTAASGNNIGGYIVTLAPSTGEAVVRTVNSEITNITVDGLLPSVEYLIAVRAIPADYYLYKESLDVDADQSVTTGAATVVYELYSEDISEGYYVIVSDGSAMKASITSNRFGLQDVAISNNKINNPDASVIWHIQANGSYWTIYNEDVNKYAAATGSNNQGALLTEVNDYAKWSFSYNNSWTVSNYWMESNSKNSILRRNGSYGFATYGASTGTAPVLFKLVDNTQWTLDRIAVTTAPTKTEYIIGETFNPSGMVVTAYYIDENDSAHTKEIALDNEDLSFNPNGALTADVTQVMITYEGKTTTQSISVVEGTLHYYTKVTSTPTDWSGQYLIVYEEGSIAFDGSKTSDTGATFEVTISNNKIQATDVINSKSFTIGSMTGGYYLLSASGKYLSGTSGSNKTNYNDSEQLNTIEFSDGNVIITSNTSVLRYNSGSVLFRYYKSSGYSSQKAIQLYKYN